MVQKILPVLSALMLGALPVQAQLRIEVIAPNTTPANTPMYVAGNFNLWNPAAQDYRLVNDSAGRYHIVLPDSVRGPLEFKLTLGSWERVEVNDSGADVANRKVSVPATGSMVYLAVIAGWKTPSAPKPRPHTASRNVSILSDSFAMPQLGRTRRVWIYLPPDYARSSRRYPVVYMQDGQNVFDNATSYAGEWGVDETLDSLHAGGDRGVIVIAVDHAGAGRLIEYNPWRRPTNDSGEGVAYVDFLVQTLKPYVDQHYRTLHDRDHTIIAGSSMGGLISLYAALKYPEVFGGAGVFSPALWIAPEILDFAKTAALPQRPRLYFVSAGVDVSGRGQAAVYDPLLQVLRARGYQEGQDFVALIRPDGAHAEWFWRREFLAAYRWLVR